MSGQKFKGFYRMQDFKSGCISLLINQMYPYFDIDGNPPSKLVLVDQVDQMKISDDGILLLQRALWEKCEEFPLFYTTMVLHDWYHNVAQGIHGSPYVEMVRTFFDERTMLILDVDADTAIYKFLQHSIGVTFDSYCRDVLFGGNLVFPNRELRIPKIERFLGSILSLWHINKSDNRRIFFPSLGNIYGRSQKQAIPSTLLIFGDTIEFITIEIPGEPIDTLLSWWSGLSIDYGKFKTAIDYLCQCYDKFNKKTG
ncbi:MAG: hypothetical protein F6K36_24225 [Symploca sp. SIO3C6]|nr:hypothetical protein [Symploca sp. SIO3C6]